jgi:hypothetical protein
MTAALPSPPSPQAVNVRQVTASSTSRVKAYSHRSLTIETTLKLSVNLLLIGTTIATVAHILPYARTLQVKLQEMRQETVQTEARVNDLKSSFQDLFDPHQARNVMQKQGHRSEPQQYRIVLGGNQSANAANAQR